MTKFKNKYEMASRFGDYYSHIYSVVGAVGAVHLRITEGSPDKHGRRTHYAGVEFHSRTPPDGSHDAPSQDRCWLLEGPCWHDGSSLWAEEHFLPLWLHDPHNHKEVFLSLQRAYREQFMQENDDEQ